MAGVGRSVIGCGVDSRGARTHLLRGERSRSSLRDADLREYYVRQAFKNHPALPIFKAWSTYVLCLGVGGHGSAVAGLGRAPHQRRHRRGSADGRFTLPACRWGLKRATMSRIEPLPRGVARTGACVEASTTLERPCARRDMTLLPHALDPSHGPLGMRLS